MDEGEAVTEASPVVHVTLCCSMGTAVLAGGLGHVALRIGA